MPSPYDSNELRSGAFVRLTDVSLNWGLASELVCAYPIPLPMVQLNVIGLAGMPTRAANSKREHPSEDTATSRVPGKKCFGSRADAQL